MIRLLFVTLGTIEPLPTTWRSNRHLQCIHPTESNLCIQNVFAHSPIAIMEQTTERSSYNNMSLGFSRYLRLSVLPTPTSLPCSRSWRPSRRPSRGGRSSATARSCSSRQTWCRPLRSTHPSSPTLVRHHHLLETADGENARLRGVDDGGEAGDAVHAQIAHGHASRLRSHASPAPTAYSSGSSLPALLLAMSPFIAVLMPSRPVLSTSRSSGVMSPACQLLRFPTVRHRHGDVDVDRLVVAHHVVDVAAVHLRHLAQRHRARLHDEVVDRHLRRLLALRGAAHRRNVRVQPLAELTRSRSATLPAAARPRSSSGSRSSEESSASTPSGAH